eukprot:320723_1
MFNPFKHKHKSSAEIVLKKKIECLVLIGDSILDNFYGLKDDKNKDIEYQILLTLNKENKSKRGGHNENKENKDDSEYNLDRNIIKMYNLSLCEIDCDGVLSGMVARKEYIKARKTHKLRCYPLDKENKLYPIKILSSMLMNKEIKIIQKKWIDLKEELGRKDIVIRKNNDLLKEYKELNMNNNVIRHVQDMNIIQQDIIECNMKEHNEFSLKLENMKHELEEEKMKSELKDKQYNKLLLKHENIMIELKNEKDKNENLKIKVDKIENKGQVLMNEKYEIEDKYNVILGEYNDLKDKIEMDMTEHNEFSL